MADKSEKTAEKDAVNFTRKIDSVNLMWYDIFKR